MIEIYIIYHEHRFDPGTGWSTRPRHSFHVDHEPNHGAYHSFAAKNPEIASKSGKSDHVGQRLRNHTVTKIC